MKYAILPLLVTLVLCAAFAGAQASTASPTAIATPLVASTTRDGTKDFDFLLGTWNVHTRILSKLFVNSHDWKDCYGRESVKEFQNGGGQLDVGEIRCHGSNPIGGITTRIYSASTRQWSIYWATIAKGLIGPPQVGHFCSNGLGIFDTYYSYRGIPTVSRYRWSVLPGNHPHFEQLYSNDNGKTWELNWESVYTRASG
jgi:hypothetical protein